MLVFWETTGACLLACRHCRASATTEAPPGELSHDEGRALIDQVAGFGRPYPILVFTGGDCLLRPDLFDLVGYASSLGVPVCLSPSVTPLLTPAMIGRIAGCGARAVSVSLDGACAATHDGVRGIPGHFGQTVQAIRDLVAAGLTVQVNTTVMSRNVGELPRVAALLAETGTHMWEVFFLVHVGRGVSTARPVRRRARGCVPLPLRRVAPRVRGAHRGGPVLPPGGRGPPGWPARAGQPALHRGCPGELEDLLGPPGSPPSAHTAPTRDGKGILFIAHDGEVYPAGFLPLSLGSIRGPRAARHLHRGPGAARDPGRPGSPAAAAGASTPTCAAGHGPARTPPPATRSVRTRPALSWSDVTCELAGPKSAVWSAARVRAYKSGGPLPVLLAMLSHRYKWAPVSSAN